MDENFVDELAKNMRSEGYKREFPVLAYEMPNIHRLLLGDGHHKTAAAIRAGIFEYKYESRFLNDSKTVKMNPSGLT